MTSLAASFPRERHAGVLLPLFSAASAEGWGIGEIPDLVTLAAWQRRAGLDFLLMLPVNELAPPGHHSPYATLSAMAIDPIYLRLNHVPEFITDGGVEYLSAGERERLAVVRQATQVDYDGVRELKLAALRRAFDRFDDEHWQHQTPRAADLVGYVEREADWLDDYGSSRPPRPFRVSSPGGSGRTAGHAVSRRRAPPVRAARPRARDPLPRLPSGWPTASGQARGPPPGSACSAICRSLVAPTRRVLQHQEKFDRELSVGTPRRVPAPTARTGPAGLRWDQHRARRLRWLRAGAPSGPRAVRWLPGRPRHRLLQHPTGATAHGVGRFTPEDPDSQQALGRASCRFPGVRRGHPGEDLGTVPDFLRRVAQRLGCPATGFRWSGRGIRRGSRPRLRAATRHGRLTTTGTHETNAGLNGGAGGART